MDWYELMPKEIGNSVWLPEDQKKPVNNQRETAWSTREVCVKCGVYPWSAVFTREMRCLPKGKNNPMLPLECSAFLFLPCLLDQSGHPDASHIQIPSLAFVKTPLPWCRLFSSLSFGGSRAKRPVSCKHVCIVEWKQNKILWKILHHMNSNVIQIDIAWVLLMKHVQDRDLAAVQEVDKFAASHISRVNVDIVE